MPYYQDPGPQPIRPGPGQVSSGPAGQTGGYNGTSANGAEGGNDPTANDGSMGAGWVDVVGGHNAYNQAAPTFDPRNYGYDAGQGAADYTQQGGQAQNRQSAQIDNTNFNQTRGYGMADRNSQMDATEMARQAALGNVPSVAQQQLLQGRDQSIQNAMAMAASARGGGANLAAAQMGAQRQAGETMGQVNQQAASLRANEMANARQQYGAMATQQRASDLQAQGLDAQQAQAQAQLEQQQHGQNDAYGLGMYGLGQHAADQVQGGNMRYGEDVAGAQLGAGQINAGIAGQNAAANAKGGAAAMSTIGSLMAMSDARLKSGIHPLTTGLHPMAQMGHHAPLQGPAATMGQVRGDVPQVYNTVNNPNVLTSDARQKTGIAPAGGSSFGWAGGDNPMARYDQMQTQGQGPDDSGGGSGGSGSSSMMSSMMSGMMGGGGDSGGGMMGGMMGGGADAGAGAGMAMSDRRLKDDVSEGTKGRGGNPVDSFLGSLNPVSYHYKPGVAGEDPRQSRYGILAQDVATTPMGRSIVDNTPMGMGIDIKHSTGALLAGEGELYARQQQLAQQLAQMKGRR